VKQQRYTAVAWFTSISSSSGMAKIRRQVRAVDNERGGGVMATYRTSLRFVAAISAIKQPFRA